MIKNKSTVQAVEWAPNHLSWSLVESPEWSIKLEEIPAGGKSGVHHHKRSRQFFFILRGESIVKVEGHSFLLKKYDGIEISLCQKHQIINNGNERLLFVLISSPNVQKDDIF